VLSQRHGHLLPSITVLILIATGSRDAVCTADAGAGFVLVWRGSPEWLIGYPNDEQELMQLTSEMMLIAIPR